MNEKISNFLLYSVNPRKMQDDPNGNCISWTTSMFIHLPLNENASVVELAQAKSNIELSMRHKDSFVSSCMIDVVDEKPSDEKKDAHYVDLVGIRIETIETDTFYKQMMLVSAIQAGYFSKLKRLPIRICFEPTFLHNQDWFHWMKTPIKINNTGSVVEG